MQLLVIDNTQTGPSFVSESFDTTSDDTVVYAVWTLAPVPSTILLLGSGLQVLLGTDESRRRRKALRSSSLSDHLGQMDEFAASSLIV